MSLTQELRKAQAEQRKKREQLRKEMIADLALQPAILPPVVYDRRGREIKGEEIWAVPPQVAIQVLNWRAAHEFGITHEYEENILAGHVRQGHLGPVSPLKPRDGKVRNGYYRLGELMKLPLQPKKAVAIAATKRGEQEPRWKKEERTLTKGGKRHYGTNS